MTNLPTSAYMTRVEAGVIMSDEGRVRFDKSAGSYYVDLWWRKLGGSSEVSIRGSERYRIFFGRHLLQKFKCLLGCCPICKTVPSLSDDGMYYEVICQCNRRASGTTLSAAINSWNSLRRSDV